MFRPSSSANIPSSKAAMSMRIPTRRSSRRSINGRPFSTQPMPIPRSEEHTSELQSLMRISYAVFCLKKKKQQKYTLDNHLDTHNKHNDGTTKSKRQPTHIEQTQLRTTLK